MRPTADLTQELETVQVLNPNDYMKSTIVSFKMETITEILAIAARLPPDQASRLVERGHLILIWACRPYDIGFGALGS